MPFLPARLNTRIALMISAVLLATGLVSGWMTAEDQASGLLEGTRQNASIVTRNIAETLARYLVTENYAEIESLLLKSAGLPDVRRLQVCEESGLLLIDVRRPPGQEPKSSARIDRLAPPAVKQTQISVHSDAILIWHPIEAGAMLGWLRAEYGLESIRAAQQKTWRNTLLLTAAWLLCSGILILLVLRPIALAISRLSVFAKELDGRKGQQIAVGAQPYEIAELAASLNEASSRLASTERQLLDEREQIRKLNRDLERRVAERTVELEAANRELEAFSYSVSHDLRAPLRTIEGFSRILIEDHGPRLDAECRRLLGVVGDAAKRMARLIDDILKFSRSGRTQITRGEIDLGAMARQVFDELRQAGGESGAELQVGPLPPALGDAAMVRQVLVNLLSNALKFSRPKDKPTIRVGGRLEDGFAEFFVSDNGVGFDMQYADKLFGTFQRLHRDEDFEGTGIGLAIVKRIVGRHGGRVWAESKLGEGATFYFTLPAKEAMDAAA